MRTATIILLLALLLPAPTAALTTRVIVFVADGWGFSQLDLQAYWRGERRPFESDPAWTRLAMSNYAWVEADDQPPYGDGAFVGLHGYDPAAAWAAWSWMQNFATDSAAAATAMATGVKTYNAAIGMGIGDGTAAGRVPLVNVMQRADALGMATGVVTSVPVSHATPAGFSAHNVDRGDYAGIALEMLAGPLDVIAGAGHPDYDDNGGFVPENPADAARYRYVGGYPSWTALRGGAAGGDTPWEFTDDPARLAAIAAGADVPSRLCALARVRETLQYNRAGRPPANDPQPPNTVPFLTGVPSLTTLALAALAVLDADPDGFVLMVEGGAVDWAGHARAAGRQIEELDDFASAVDAVVEWISARNAWDATLVVVTGDHETGFLWGPGVDPARPGTWFRPLQDNGPGVMPGFRYYTGGHSNQVIPFFARGAGAGRFAARADESDPVRGAYLDNTELAPVLFDLLAELGAESPPPALALLGNHPNPFNPGTTIRIALPAAGRAVLAIHDVRGRLVRTLHDGVLPAGEHEVRWNGVDRAGRRVASGVYRARLTAGGRSVTRPLAVLR